MLYVYATTYESKAIFLFLNAVINLFVFTQVDIIFEDDLGFLATVQHFMASTKVPIVLTARDPAFRRQLCTRHEYLHFKRPILVRLENIDLFKLQKNVRTKFFNDEIDPIPQVQSY